MLLHQFLQAWLENGTVPVHEHLALLGVFFDAAHGVADGRQTRSSDQTHIAAANDRYIHNQVLTLRGLSKTNAISWRANHKMAAN